MLYLDTITEELLSDMSSLFLNNEGEYTELYLDCLKDYTGKYAYSPRLNKNVKILKVDVEDKRNPIFYTQYRNENLESTFHVFELHEIIL